MSRLQVFGLDFSGLIPELLDEVAREAKEYAQSITPKGSTGRLHASIGIISLGKSARKVYTGDKRKYARMALLDIGPFEIQPKRAKALRFISRMSNKPAFAKHVMYPGGHNVFGRTEDWVKANAGRIVDNVMAHHPKGGPI